jgi:predicted negative regulator of RcsB-dependent stress response
LMDQNQLAEAAQQLNSVAEAGAYAYLYTELRGDLAMLEGNTAEAAGAYRQALDSMPAQAPNAALLSAKYDSVSGAGSATQ